MKRLTAGALALVMSQTAALAQGAVTVTHDLPGEIVRTLVWAGIAAILFVLAFKAVDWSIPGDLKQQLAEGNTAMAVFVAGVCIAFAIIIAALVG
jgi:uncharacterized membrane protein YjfL (UPF0719 family)